MAPGLAAKRVAHGHLRDADMEPDLPLREASSPQIENQANALGRKFSPVLPLTPGRAPMAHHVRRVLGVGSPKEVARAAVRWIAVDMANLMADADRRSQERYR